MEKLIAFHVDMNVGRFTRGYLERWLRALAAMGYNTVVWEVENSIAWETCPECVGPDAFGKAEFREILALARSLGLEAVPLFQTIGHCEYVLKHPGYAHLRELPDDIRQYCPLHPELLPLLRRWIEEYLEVFGDVRLFHLGADEAWNLGRCPRCAAFAETHSLSRLYINHINAVSEPLRSRGVTPAIWGDMVLKHPEALAELSRDIVVFDWMYDIHRGKPTVWVWGKGRVKPDELGGAVRERFGPFLFPEECPEGFNIFYTTDYLRAEGFTVVTCPGASSYGDNVFTPLESKHQPNTWDFAGKGLADAAGTCLTSWSVHLHPWELQRACIGMPPYRAAHPTATLDEYRADFTREVFGVEATEFFEACAKLEVLSPWTYTSSLGYDKSCPEVPPAHIRKAIERLRAEDKLEAELVRAREGFASYEEGRDLILKVQRRAGRGGETLEAWLLAADALTHRARSAIHLLTRALGRPEGEADVFLRELDDLEARYRAFYTPIHRPARREQILRWLFASLRRALEG